MSGNTIIETETKNKLEQNSRIEFARKYGLPDTATWSDINITSEEVSRIDFAKRNGLPETATWGEINSATEISAKPANFSCLIL